MAKVTSVVVSRTFDSLRTAARSAARAFIIAIKYPSHFHASIRLNARVGGERSRRCAEIQERETRCLRRKRRAYEPAKYFPIPINFPLHHVFANILPDRLTTSLKSFRSKIILIAAPWKYAITSLSLMRQRKLKINKNFKLIDRYRRFPVTRSSSAVPNNKNEWFLDEKDAKIFALGTEKVVVDSSSRFSSPSSVSSVTGYRTTRCAMDATGMDSSTSLHHFSSAKFARIWIFIVHPR